MMKAVDKRLGIIVLMVLLCIPLACEQDTPSGLSEAELDEMKQVLDGELKALKEAELAKQEEQKPKTPVVMEDLVPFVHEGKTIYVTEEQARQLKEQDATIARLLKANAENAAANKKFKEQLDEADAKMRAAAERMKENLKTEEELKAELEFQQLMTKELKKAIEEEKARQSFVKVGLVKASEGGEVLINPQTDTVYEKGTAFLVVRKGKILSTVKMKRIGDNGLVAEVNPNAPELIEGDQVIIPVNDRKDAKPEAQPEPRDIH